MSSSKVNSRISKAKKCSEAKQPKAQHEVIGLDSDDEREVINLISDDESEVQQSLRKPVAKPSHLKAKKNQDIAKSPARPGLSYKHPELAEQVRQKDVAARRAHMETLNMRKRLLAESESDSEPEAVYAADRTRQKMMKREGDRLKSMWAQMDAKNDS